MHYPELHLCTDNGAMIAMAAAMRLQAGVQSATTGYAFDVKPRWPLDRVTEHPFGWPFSPTVNCTNTEPSARALAQALELPRIGAGERRPVPEEVEVLGVVPRAGLGEVHRAEADRVLVDDQELVVHHRIARIDPERHALVVEVGRAGIGERGLGTVEHHPHVDGAITR